MPVEEPSTPRRDQASTPPRAVGDFSQGTPAAPQRPVSPAVLILSPYVLNETDQEGSDDEQAEREKEARLRKLVRKMKRKGFSSASFTTPQRSPKRKNAQAYPYDSNNILSDGREALQLPSRPFGNRDAAKRPRHVSPASIRRLNFTPPPAQQVVHRRLEFLVPNEEVENFFNAVEAAADDEIADNIVAFIQRFNFDFVNGVPLPGRFDWEEL